LKDGINQPTKYGLYHTHLLRQRARTGPDISDDEYLMYFQGLVIASNEGKRPSVGPRSAGDVKVEIISTSAGNHAVGPPHRSEKDEYVSEVTADLLSPNFSSTTTTLAWIVKSWSAVSTAPYCWKKTCNPLKFRAW
jgi:hypothetical protein